MPSLPPIRPIHVTTGGALDLRDIIGRDDDTDRIAQVLRRDSVLLTGDRRIGKTSLSRLIEERLITEEFRTARVSAERTSIVDFQNALASALKHTVLGKVRDELERWTVSVKAGPVGAERSGQIAPLDELIRLSLGPDSAPPLVLIIDEIPILAQAMEKRHPGTGADLLIMLRRIRQESGRRLSMLLMGSMGFHHVATDAPGSLNDIAKVPLQPVSADWAVYHARCLMLGEGVSPSNDRLVAEAVAAGAECVPFYVQHLVKDCRDRYRGRIVTPSMVNDLIEIALTDGEDRWDLKHYRDRIPAYFGSDRVELIGAILDVYVDASQPLVIDEVLRVVATDESARGLTRDGLRELVEKLEQDHYLTKVGRASEFRSNLLRRAWRELRR